MTYIVYKEGELILGKYLGKLIKIYPDNYCGYTGDCPIKHEQMDNCNNNPFCFCMYYCRFFKQQNIPELLEEIKIKVKNEAKTNNE